MAYDMLAHLPQPLRDDLRALNLEPLTYEEDERPIDSYLTMLRDVGPGAGNFSTIKEILRKKIDNYEKSIPVMEKHNRLGTNGRELVARWRRQIELVYGKLTELTAEFCEFIPEDDKLKPGVLYVAQEYGASIHLCACGCGQKVSLPFLPDRIAPPHYWHLTTKHTENGDLVTLRPSVGNWQQPCKTHYFITDSKIEWR